MSIYKCMALENFKWGFCLKEESYALAVSLQFDGRPYMRCNFITYNNTVLAGLPTWHKITLRNIRLSSIT